MGMVVRINTHSAGTVVEDNKIGNKQCFEELQKEKNYTYGHLN